MALTATIWPGASFRIRAQPRLIAASMPSAIHGYRCLEPALARIAGRSAADAGHRKKRLSGQRVVCQDVYLDGLGGHVTSDS